MKFFVFQALAIFFLFAGELEGGEVMCWWLLGGREGVARVGSRGKPVRVMARRCFLSVSMSLPFALVCVCGYRFCSTRQTFCYDR